MIMKKCKVSLLLTFLFLALTGFSYIKIINLSVRIENLNDKNDSLKLEFKPVDFEPRKRRPVTNGKIDIFKNDTLFISLVADSINNIIGTWHFPSIPNGYRMIYPQSDKQIPFVSKSDHLEFIFSYGYHYLGKWEYKPFFSDKRAKWLFHESGIQKFTIKSEYEHWVGKDIITIKMNDRFSIEDTNIQLFDSEGNALDFEIKHKRNPTNIIALKMMKKQKKGQRLKLILEFGQGRYYEDEITVPDNNPIGVAGKYNSL